MQNKIKLCLSEEVPDRNFSLHNTMTDMHTKTFITHPYLHLLTHAWESPTEDAPGSMADLYDSLCFLFRMVMATGTKDLW